MGEMAALHYIKIGNNLIPYYKFKYDGGQPYHRFLHRHKHMHFYDGERINEHFARLTATQINLNENYPVFNKATMFIIHKFCQNDAQAKDLDNLDYKPVIDAVRMTRIIPDDSWNYLSLSLIGDVDNIENIEAYLVPDACVREFLQQVLTKYYVPSYQQIIEKNKMSID